MKLRFEYAIFFLLLLVAIVALTGIFSVFFVNSNSSPIILMEQRGDENTAGFVYGTGANLRTHTYRGYNIFERVAYFTTYENRTINTSVSMNAKGVGWLAHRGYLYKIKINDMNSSQPKVLIDVTGDKVFDITRKPNQHFALIPSDNYEIELEYENYDSTNRVVTVNEIGTGRTMHVSIDENRNGNLVYAGQNFRIFISKPDIPNFPLKVDIDGENSLDVKVRVGRSFPLMIDDTLDSFDSEFVSQRVPLELAPGQWMNVSITYRNTGSETWSNTNKIRIGAPNYANFWDKKRVTLRSGDTVTPGEEYSFTFTIAAPEEPGEYRWVWRTIQAGGVGWFGEEAERLNIQVVDLNHQQNIKDTAMYSDKEVFLVSNQNWREVLTLLPLTIWTNDDNTVTTYPLLIYHQENDQTNEVFDPDSILHFLNQYNTEKVSFYGNLPTEFESTLQNSFNTESTQETLSYWQEYYKVVYVENDYETGLLASTYASLINAPLFIEGYNDAIDLSSKHIICVGNVNINCAETYSIKELQQEYLKKTNTNKILLTNPTLNINILGSKQTDGGKISELYGGASLASPILAAAKHELLLFTNSNTMTVVDSYLKSDIDRLSLDPEYLTILASPLEIENTMPLVRSYNNKTVHWSVDNTVYGNLDNDEFGFAELKTGRIFGFTISDVSAYIARVLFYDQLEKSENFLFIGQGVSNDEDMERYSKLFNENGYISDFRTYENPTQPRDYEDVAFLFSGAHGSPTASVFASQDIPLLTNTLIIEGSCLTCAFDYLYTGTYRRLFCAEEIRKGSIGVISSVDTAGFNWDFTRMNWALTGDIGTAFKHVQNLGHARKKWYTEIVAKEFDYTAMKADIKMLLGDPTFTFESNDPILPAIQQQIEHTPEHISVELSVPSINIDQEETRVIIEGTDSHLSQPKYNKFFTKIGPLDLFDQYTVESDDVNPFFWGGINDIAIQEDIDGTYMYLVIEKDLTENPLNEIIWNNITITITKT